MLFPQKAYCVYTSLYTSYISMQIWFVLQDSFVLGPATTSTKFSIMWCQFVLTPTGTTPECLYNPMIRMAIRMKYGSHSGCLLDSHYVNEKTTPQSSTISYHNFRRQCCRLTKLGGTYQRFLPSKTRTH